jgi:Na+/alanine symporter
MKKPGTYIAIFIAIVIALIAYSTLVGKLYRAEICMVYQGRTACKTVTGKSETAVVRGGISNACADIAAGVTETMGCEQTQPASLKWLQRPKRQ